MVRGLQAALNNLKIIGKKYKAVEGPAIRALAEAVASEARKIVPVDTGRLRNSITTSGPVPSGKGFVAFVSTNVKYAVYVELGTYKMKAQPYLRPALRKVLGRKAESVILSMLLNIKGVK